MPDLRYVKPDRLSLKESPEFDERWLQARIAEDPSVLGLGELILKDVERVQPRAGRLDLLLQDPDANIRYEAEIQLGATDESHIIRTIEYWDIERKRYPQYDHIAVIAAEDITSRFLNVIGLFNGVIPLIAVQMSAFRIGDQVSLLSTIVLDQRLVGYLEEEEEEPTVDRSYWEKRGTKETMWLAEKVLELVRAFAPDFELKYNAHYIGLARSGQPHNFVVLRPQKQALRIEPRLKQSPDTEGNLEEAGFEIMDYHVRNGRYRIRLTKEALEGHEELLMNLLQRSYQEFGG